MNMKNYVHHLEFGNGETLVLLPSNWLTSKSYQSIAKKLSEKYRVIVPDLYRGDSKYEKNALTPNDFVATLHLFLNRLNVKKFYLIGFSFSGLIAVEYAHQYPLSIKKMMLVSSIKFPVSLKKNNFTLVAGLVGYIKLFFHNTFSLKGIKVSLLWLCDGFNFFINHPKQFFLDALIATKYSQDSSFGISFPTKIVLASNDEFIACKEIEKIKNLEVEVVEGCHTWFFLNEELFVEKVFNYFNN